MSISLDGKRKDNGDRIVNEAASWIAQLDGGDISNADRIALAEWMARSPRHENEIRRLASLWSSVNDVLDEAITTPKHTPITSILAAWFKIRPVTLAGVTAAIMAPFAGIAVALFVFAQPVDDTQNFATYHVKRGEMRTITLVDGSLVHLNTDSVAEIYDLDSARVVRLIRGEGMFSVEKDPARPFQVIAGAGVVEAVGTRFTVRVLEGDIDVTVSEGAIRMAKASDKIVTGQINRAVEIDRQETNAVSSGYVARLVDEKVTVKPIEPEEISRKTAWLDGGLVFNGETLEVVVSEVTRYTDVQIVISDSSLRDVRIGGVFKTGEVDPFLNALQTSFDIKVKRLRPGLIYLEENKV